mgnify:CR=1 FL=1
MKPLFFFLWILDSLILSNGLSLSLGVSGVHTPQARLV